MNTNYISHGTYGCVMRPSVPCKKDKGSDDNTVSKIFHTSKSALEEYRFNAKIAKEIDPNGVFTIKELDYCTVALSKFPEVKKCQWDDEEMRQKLVKQIVYEYGGMSLGEACIIVHPNALFTTFRPLFLGLVTLEKKGWVHSDIKPANLLFNPNTRKTAYIDWGMLTKMKDVYKSGSKMFFSYPYYYYPPEFILYNNKIKPNAHGDPLDNFKLFFGNPVVQRALKSFGEKIYNMFYIEMYDDFKEYLRNSAGHTFDPAKIDTFSLGVSIIQMIVNENGIHKYSKKLRDDLVKLAGRMCWLNPVQRLSAEEALAKFEKIFKRRLCAPRKIQNIVTGRCGLKTRQAKI